MFFVLWDDFELVQVRCFWTLGVLMACIRGNPDVGQPATSPNTIAPRSMSASLPPALLASMKLEFSHRLWGIPAPFAAKNWRGGRTSTVDGTQTAKMSIALPNIGTTKSLEGLKPTSHSGLKKMFLPSSVRPLACFANSIPTPTNVARVQKALRGTGPGL